MYNVHAIGIYHRLNYWVTYFLYNPKTNDNFEKSLAFFVFFRVKTIIILLKKKSTIL